jgi:hypothetical protein
MEASSYGSFLKSPAGIATLLVGTAAVVGGAVYYANNKTAATATAGASVNPSGAPPTGFTVAQGSQYVFDITVSTAALNWMQAANGPTALNLALQSAGWAVQSIQPDPSVPDGSRYAVIATWNLPATATQDNPAGGWSIDATSLQAATNALLPQTWAMPVNNDWYTFTVATSFQGVTPANIALYVQAFLYANGFGAKGPQTYANILVTPSASNPLNVNVAAQWNGQATSFLDGPPLWWLLAAPVDAGSSQSPQPSNA